MIEYQSRTTARAASLAGAMLFSTSAAYSGVDNQHLRVSVDNRELITRFWEGRSGDLQWQQHGIDYVERGHEKKVEVIEPALMVNTILSSLGLGMTDLEKVLGVKRATIYNWRNGGEVRADDSIVRLREVYQVAKKIAAFNTKPFGKRVKSHTIKGKSYLDLLSAKSLNINAIVEHAQVLSSQESARIKASQKSKSTNNDIDNILGGWHQV